MKIRILTWGRMLLIVMVSFGTALFVDNGQLHAQSDDPSAVAQTFYDVYLDYLLNTGHPVNDRIYRDSDLVSQHLVQTMDARIDEGVFADPFLCAQNFPDSVSVFDNQVNGDIAVVVMTTNFDAHFLTVDMVRENGAWKLDAVACGDRLNSVRAVENFYSWYIAELQSGNNPIVDDSFRERGELSSTLIAAMDQQITEGLAADPFVCAQNSVGRIDVVEVLTWQPEMRLLIKTNLDNPITLSVLYSNGAWQIDAITCGDHLSPRAVTDDFYGWYVDFTKTQGNPLTDRAYQDSEWLAWSLIQTTNRILEEGIAFDPFVCAQDYPDSFTSTLITSDGRHASVQVTTLPIDHTFTVSLIQMGPVWQIDEVVCPIP